MKETIYEKTPTGADYSEVIYFDGKNNETDKEKATRAIIRELKKDGTLLNETFMNITKN